MEAKRQEIFDLIDSIPGSTVFMERPEVIEVFPCFTYRIVNNNPQYDLDKEIGKQDIEVVIDIWSEGPIEGDSLLVALEAKMKEKNYLLSYSADIIDPDGYSHITTNFIY